MKASPNSFRVYRFLGRDIVALPDAAPGLRAAGVSSLPATTLRARAFRGVLTSLVSFGLDGALVEKRRDPCEAPARFDWGEFVRALERALGVDLLIPVVVPARQSARARTYIHLLTPRGERMAFVKLATDSASDACLELEATTLRQWMRTGAETFRFPSLLGAGRFQGRSYLLLAPLPARARPHTPVWTPRLTAIRAEIAGAGGVLPSVTAASWWPAFHRAAGSVAALADEVHSSAGAFPYAGTHGDFVNWNIYLHGEDHWVFDWEASAPDGPVLADEVRFTLGKHTRALGTGAAGVAASVMRELGCADASRRRAVALALAFLHARATTSATLLASHWGKGVQG